MEIWKIAIIIIALVILFVVLLYNRLISLNNRLKNAWSNIDNQLKRRNDLIPNLLNVVKGYAAYEKETLESIVLARSQNLRAKNMKEGAKSSEQLTDALNRLFALSEAYPELKADQAFQKLQVELIGTEDKIAFARQFYNDTVQKYNDKLLVFPNNLIAKQLKFKPKEYFKVDEEEKVNVKVEFDK